jgi:RNA polymerase sigma-70 factor (ECF subfamily)
MSESGSNNDDRTTVAGAVFATTRWTVVLNAGHAKAPEAAAALEQLCRTYWYPLYAFVRREGRSPHDAQDLTQEFFARLLERNDVASVDRAKGRFRSFLLAALKNFLANERLRVRALKRGGGAVHVPIDTGSAETRYGVEVADDRTPEALFERRWALTVLDTVLERLCAEQQAAGKADQFEKLRGTLSTKSDLIPYATLAAQLGASEGAVKVIVHRLRQRYRAILREEIAQTVPTPAEIEPELRHLLAALGGVH